MAFDTSSYLDPNVYLQEIVVPSGLNISGPPFAVTLIGTGSRNKRITNEVVQRGLVSNETLTPASISPHTATLVNRGDRKVANTTVRRTVSGIATIIPDAFISYDAAVATGSAAGTFNIATNNAFGLEMDGKAAITIRLLSGAPGVTVAGRQINATGTLAGAGATASRAEVATLINSALNAATAAAMGVATELGYGPTYNAVASDATTGIRITSLGSSLTNPYLSDVRIFQALTTNASTTLFGSATLDSTTIIRISDLAWSATATWKADYVAFSSDVDNVAQTAAGLTSMIRVGSFAGGSDFNVSTDWQLTSSQVDWSPDAAPILTGSVASPYDIEQGATDNDLITLSIDGKTAISIDLQGLASPPLGYTAPVNADAATAAEIVLNINAVIGANANYGPRYNAVAVVSGSFVRLTSPTQGTAGSVSLQVPASQSAVTTIFGVSANTVALGTGRRPTQGSLYYVTYEYARPSSGASNEYNKPYVFFDVDSAKAQVGQVSSDVLGYNPLAQAVELAFLNGAPLIYTVQVNDASTPGTPTRQELQLALDAAAVLDGCTEILVLDEPGTRLETFVDVLAHIEQQCAPTEAHYRRGWMGVAAGTAIGDADTTGTIVNKAARTLQVQPASAGRGRLFLVAPPQQAGVTRDLTLEDGSTVRRTVDSTYLAVACASLKTSLNVADSLAQRTIRGFNIDDVLQPWKKAERGLMAGNGVLVVTFDAGGRFILLDPVSTEGGGGNLIQFKQDSSSFQKDNLSRKIRLALNANIVGIVPFDLASFIIDIKLVIANVISSEISKGAVGPFRTDAGASRPIDLRRDLQVSQSTTDPTTYHFNFWYGLRYPALRLLGSYSVDNPFFSAA